MALTQAPEMATLFQARKVEPSPADDKQDFVSDVLVPEHKLIISLQWRKCSHLLSSRGIQLLLHEFFIIKS